jgi:hypothetical protein
MVRPVESRLMHPHRCRCDHVSYRQPLEVSQRLGQHNLNYRITALELVVVPLYEIQAIDNTIRGKVAAHHSATAAYGCRAGRGGLLARPFVRECEGI